MQKHQPPAFSELRAAPLSEVAREAIREAIMDGRIAPGEALNQVDLARQLGISRGPLREALRQLEKEGLVTHTPYRGTIAAPLTERDVIELQAIRRLLELFAIEQMLEHSNEDDFAALHAIVDRMEESANTHDWRGLSEADMEFHDHIFRLSNNSLLYNIWQTQLQQLRRVLALRNRLNPEPGTLATQHRELVNALQTRDHEAIRRCYSQHGNDLAIVLEQFQANNELPLTQQSAISS